MIKSFLFANIEVKKVKEDQKTILKGLKVLLICLLAYMSFYIPKLSKDNIPVLTVATAYAERIEPIVYDGMTMDELATKIEGFLNSDLKGKGYLYASYSLELGVDPYLAVAISLHETGCRFDCSRLVKQCNNVGGQKGSPKCPGSSYKSYETLDEGIKGFIENIAIKYYAYGLTTPELMNSKYAADKGWGKKVNAYINKMKAN